jgi:hypothetical protein
MRKGQVGIGHRKKSAGLCVMPKRQPSHTHTSTHTHTSADGKVCAPCVSGGAQRGPHGLRHRKTALRGRPRCQSAPCTRTSPPRPPSSPYGAASPPDTFRSHQQTIMNK